MRLAIDIGASKLRIAEVNHGQLQKKQVISTPKQKKDILKRLFELISNYPLPKEIGVGVAGLVQEEKVIKTPNMDFNNVSLKEILQKKYQIPVHIENDARCAGLAEMKYGVGKDYQNVIMLTLGTGIGGAIFIDGKLYKGHAFAGEIGHTLIDNKELEKQATGGALIKLQEKYGFHKKSSYELVSLANKKDPHAKKLFEDMGKSLGLALINLSCILDPQLIILGGGFSNVKALYPSLHKTMKRIDPLKVHRTLKIIPARFQDDGGLIGASLLK